MEYASNDAWYSIMNPEFSSWKSETIDQILKVEHQFVFHRHVVMEKF